MSDNLQVTYETLEGAARKSDDTAEQFLAQLTQLEGEVKSMTWVGQSGTAFQAFFDQTKQQLQPVQETLHALAASIREASRTLQESDAAVAGAFKAQ